MTVKFVIEALSPAHDRKSFRSGNAKIDAFFGRVVSQDVRRGYATCYVASDKETGRVAGFYTLSASAIPLAEMSVEIARKLPRYPNIPAVLIGWLAVDAAFQGRQLGTMLLYDAVARVTEGPIGVFALFADAIDERAASFYRKFGFIAFDDRPMTLFLPLTHAPRRFSD